MKKLISLIIAVTALSCTASAANIGDIIGETLTTDIVASINEYNIESYNIDGYTAVVAEDLRNYGFCVDWNGDERALYIRRDMSTNMVASTYTAPYIPKSKIGEKAYDILHTDIKAYIDGQIVRSHNIDGRTIIYFDDLSAYGEVVYNNDTRRLDLTIRDGLNFWSSYEVTRLVNDMRAVNGVAPVEELYALSELARIKAKDMAVNGYFSHSSPTYGSPFDMMDNFGITFMTAGENIARGQKTPAQVVESWMNSEGHRKNILNPEFTKMGVGYCADANTWVQMFIG